MDTPLSKRPWLDDILIGLSYYFFTSLIVVLGVMFGREFVKPLPNRPVPSGDLLSCFARWDGQNYKSIVERGYFYDPERRSNVAFFPAYPLLGRLIVEATGMRTEAALLILSHTFLAGAFILLRTYTRLRFPDAGPRMWDTTLLAFGVFPTTFFFRMTYTESMFVFLTIVALLGMERKWPVLLIALVCGLATATRPVGVALIPPFILHLWHRSESWRNFAWQSALLLPVSCWGLVGYMAYQDAVFDEPLAFAKTQENYRMCMPDPSMSKLESLVTFEPIWGVFVPSSIHFWRTWEWHEDALFSLLIANPILFVLATGLIVIGLRNGSLRPLEFILALLLLLIPYVTRANENSMASAGRFAAAVTPLYSVTAFFLTRSHVSCKMLLVANGTFFLAMYAALFSAGYLLI